MNKLRPRNKICFQNNQNIHSNLNINKLNKKKWILLKKNIFWNNKKKEKLLTSLKIFKNLAIARKKTFEYKNLLKKYTKNKRPPKKKLYKERLFAKQQFKNFYGCIPEYQLKNLFKNLKLKKTNNIIQKFIILLESRLDMIIYRSKITKTIFEAKQIINHGKIKINDKIITSSNFILNKGDIISLNNFKLSKKFFYKSKNIIDNNNIFLKKFRKNKVNYIEFNNKLNICIFLRKPLFNEIKYPFELNLKLIDEYFKKN
uniref:Ribosomal protein S4 n=1 Tax=Aphanomyces astaci TaxID=112090 RepID=A0A1I9Q6C4_APHAT|nr:ribosomal protein S4 [Aphanomyces astaci]AOQ30612.1 ribosomal protein S4 [Aphanomyces astaci]